jgi:signal transduction histidine kinase
VSKRFGGGHAGLLLAVGVLLLGLIASWVTAAGMWRTQHRVAEQAMDRKAGQAQAAVTTETRRYLDELRGVAGALGAFDRLTRPKFLATVAPLANSKLVGATEVTFVVPATDDRIGDVQAYWRQAIPDLQLRPAGSGHEHMFAVLSLRLDGTTPSVPGGDVAQSAEPSRALLDSRDSGRPAVSDTYVLMRDRDLPAARRQLSFSLTAPVYGVPDEAGRRPFKGWVLMGMHGRDFIGGTLRTVTEDIVNASLWAPGSHDQQVEVAALTTEHHPDLYRRATITVADREWTLRTAASSANLPGVTTALPLLTGVAGSVIAALLGGLVFILATGRARAEARVVAATAELRRSEERTRDQASLLTSIVNTISDGVAVVDRDGQELLQNPAARMLTGMTSQAPGPDARQRHTGMYLPDGVTPFPTDELPLIRALHGEPTDGVEMVIRNDEHPDGVVLSVSGWPLEGATGATGGSAGGTGGTGGTGSAGGGQVGAVAVFHDVTAVRQHEAELTAFAGVVAHDLKSPLTAVLGYADLARAALADLPPNPSVENARRDLARVVAGASHMRRLIDDLLAYATARDAPLRPEPVDLYATATEIVAERTNHLRGTGAPMPDISLGPLPPVVADPGMVRRVLDNLIGNALKYVPPNEAAHLDVSAGRRPDGWISVNVSDRGIGIPESAKPHIFDTFFRAHPGSSQAGTGLGLAICRRIIDRHGGTIAVADNPGGGTRIVFTLPAADRAGQ